MRSDQIDNLMKKVQDGDEQAFADLYEKTYKGVFGFIYSYVKNRADAEDMLQETYIRVKFSAPLYTLGTNATAWILQIAKNICIDNIRKNTRHPNCELDENLVKATPTDQTDALYIHNLINETLPEVDRQIIYLHLLYGYKNREIAEIMDLPLGTVLWKYNRALKVLKEKIKEN